MKIAIPVWRDRISPVFDVARTLLLVDVEAGAETGRNNVTLAEDDPGTRAKRLNELRADLVICGAISQTLEAMLAAAGVDVISRTCGGVEQVLQAYRLGRLTDRSFAMPGCCGRRLPRSRAASP